MDSKIGFSQQPNENYHDNFSPLPNLSDEFPKNDPDTFFNTLAQLSQIDENLYNAGAIQDFTHLENYNIENEVLNGIFLNKKDAEKLQKRAKSKYLTQNILNALIELESPLKKSYEVTKNCSHVILQDENKLTSKYCNQRWCLVCNRIRTAKLINGYSNDLNKLVDKQFLTLSRPNVTGDNLKREIQRMQKKWRLIYKDVRNKIRGNKSLKLSGIKKIECTYNAERNDYHPHFHFIIEGEGITEYILQRWLEHNPDASTTANKFFKLRGEKSYIEIFKYFTKFWTTKKVQHKHKYYNDAGKPLRKEIGDIYIFPLDIIFQSMYKNRTFESFGITKTVSENIEEITSEEFEIAYNTNVFAWNGQDWEDSYNILLSGYQPDEFSQILQEKIIF